ncbi:MAG: hypothetical protein ACAH59_06495 [Pseudobdellovibrionaceae bacterium]
MKIWAVLGLILTSLTLEAKVFRNAYVAFELPETWKCVLEHTEWVCRSESAADSKQAIIILTAKEVGPTDSFDSYTQHLNTPQKAQVAGAVPSRVVSPSKQNRISDQVWVDGLHMGSEVPNYFTRYLATIKDRIAILITFSAHKDFYTKYSQDFFKAAQSLRVIATKNLLDKPELGPIRPGGETLGAPIGNAMPSDLMMPEAGGSAAQGSRTKMMLLGIAVLLAGLAIYVFIKMKKK